jgi:hypothetical protein
MNIDLVIGGAIALISSTAILIIERCFDSKKEERDHKWAKEQIIKEEKKKLFFERMAQIEEQVRRICNDFEKMYTAFNAVKSIQQINESKSIFDPRNNLPEFHLTGIIEAYCNEKSKGCFANILLAFHAFETGLRAILSSHKPEQELIADLDNLYKSTKFYGVLSNNYGIFIKELDEQKKQFLIENS